MSKRTLLVCCCCILYSFDNRGRSLERESRGESHQSENWKWVFGVYRWNSSTQSELVTSSDHVCFFLSQLVTHRLHGELNFYPKISALVNIQFPDNSLL